MHKLEAGLLRRWTASRRRFTIHRYGTDIKCDSQFTNHRYGTEIKCEYDHNSQFIMSNVISIFNFWSM